MTATDISVRGRLWRSVYLLALAVSAVAVGWVTVTTLRAGPDGPDGVMRALGALAMVLLIPFGPTLCLLVAAAWLAIARRPAPAVFRFLAIANAAWSVILTRARVAL